MDAYTAKLTNSKANLKSHTLDSSTTNVSAQQGRIHGSPVAGGRAGAVYKDIQKSKALPIDRPTEQPADAESYWPRC